MKHIYNLKPTPSTHKFHSSNLKVSPPSSLPLPPKVDLRDSGLFDDVYDQKNLGSCTGNGLAASINYLLRFQKLAPLLPNPSRLFIYWNERFEENTVDSDSGASIGDGCRTLETYGVCSEKTWEYNVDKFKIKPINEAFDEAKNNTLLQFNRCDNVMDMKHSLASSLPVVIGITLYESFETEDVAKTGIVPLPVSTEEILGGHCMVCVGYDDDKQFIIVRNSWGTKWGNKGYCQIPYTYLINNLSEAYVLSIVK
jgi:C1A family cysteine protease